MAAREGEKGNLTQHHIDFHSFFAAVSQTPSLSHAHFPNMVGAVLWHCYLLAAHIIPYTPKLTLLLAFKLSNYSRECGEITTFLC